MYKLDATIPPLENSRFHNLYNPIIRQMVANQSQFTETELVSLLLVYHKFVMANGPKARYMTKKQLNNIFFLLFKIDNKPMVDRMLACMINDLKKDVDPVTWVKLFELFTNENLSQTIKIIFQIYGTKNGNTLDRQIVTRAVQNFFTLGEEDEQTELCMDMVEMIFKKFDLNHDGLIQFEEYEEVVSKQPMLLEFLGRCLPTQMDKSVVAHCTNLMSIIEKDKKL